MRIGFIGTGNMASAIVRGIVDAGEIATEDVIVTSLHGTSARALAQETGVDVVETNEELVEQVGPGGLVVLAVKPYAVESVLTDLQGVLDEYGSVVVSLAAGTSIATLESFLAAGQPVVRVMPNVNARVRASASAVCANEHTSEEAEDEVVRAFESVGMAVALPEAQFSAFTGIAGSSPAFVFAFIDALARGGVRGGIPKAQATRIAAQAVLGSAQLVLDRLGEGMGPKQLEDTVTSPGGTTIAGTVELDHAGFTSAVLRGVQAVIDRDVEMGSKG